MWGSFFFFSKSSIRAGRSLFKARSISLGWSHHPLEKWEVSYWPPKEDQKSTNMEQLCFVYFCMTFCEDSYRIEHQEPTSRYAEMCAPCSPLCETLLKASNACLLTFFFCASRSMEPPTLRMSKFFISNIWSSPQSVVLWHRAWFQSRHALSWMALLATCPLQVLAIEKSLQKFKQPLVCYIAGSRNWCSKNSVAKLLWSPEESSVWRLEVSFQRKHFK